MRIILDGHIHSKYSRATSRDMNIQHIARFAKIKGLNVVGTGDFTHPSWFKELKEALEPSVFEGLYTPVGQPKSQVYFMVTAEVCTISYFEGKARRVHHVIWAPNLEVAEQVSDVLSMYGSLETDGRPTLTIDPPELVEVVTELSSRLFLFPAHAWTPWFSLFGAFSGFNRLKDCYQDMASRVYALETGLSSDPPMNWRISELDRLAIISNSDSHSYWPWRLGREANVLEVKEPSYQAIIEVFKTRSEGFLLTVETDPSYGKYHWTGHRNCGISMPAKEAVKLKGICPVCGKRMTKGVEERVEELADRPEGYMPLGAPKYVHLIPLSEIIATALGLENPQDPRVWEVYNGLISKFGSEFNVLLNAPYIEVEKLAGKTIASLLAAVKEDRVKIKPGYDGVYGRLLLEGEKFKTATKASPRQKGTLEDFF